jgi:hypothetical protein
MFLFCSPRVKQQESSNESGVEGSGLTRLDRRLPAAHAGVQRAGQTQLAGVLTSETGTKTKSMA